MFYEPNIPSAWGWVDTERERGGAGPIIVDDITFHEWAYLLFLSNVLEKVKLNVHQHKGVISGGTEFVSGLNLY